MQLLLKSRISIGINQQAKDLSQDKCRSRGDEERLTQPATQLTDWVRGGACCDYPIAAGNSAMATTSQPHTTYNSNSVHPPCPAQRQCK